MSRVFVVEDSAALRFAMSQFFQGRGYRVDQAETAAEAIEHLSRRSYTAVILDWSLTAEGHEGAQVLHWLRTTKTRRKPRVIVVTALNDPEIQQTARRLGAHEVLPKPVKLAELAELIPSPRRGKPGRRRE